MPSEYELHELCGVWVVGKIYTKPLTAKLQIKVPVKTCKTNEMFLMLLPCLQYW